MSWQATRDGVMKFVCKVSPKGQTCRDYLNDHCQQCSKSDKSYMKTMLEMPQNLWRSAYTRNDIKDTDLSVCALCENEGHETAILTGAFQIIMILAVIVAVLYGILKATAQRRLPVQ